jgi:hypothetical protein
MCDAPDEGRLASARRYRDLVEAFSAEYVAGRFVGCSGEPSRARSADPCRSACRLRPAYSLRDKARTRANDRPKHRRRANACNSASWQPRRRLVD